MFRPFLIGLAPAPSVPQSVSETRDDAVVRFPPQLRLVTTEAVNESTTSDRTLNEPN